MRLHKHPSKILMEPCRDVEDPFHAVIYLEGMRAILSGLPSGAALAANQAGVPLRFFVVAQRMADRVGLPEAVVNPQVLSSSDEKETDQEGCLSFPGLWIPVRRSKKISVEYSTIDGMKKTAELSDFAARLFLHEVEHLDGKNFLSGLGHGRRTRELKKYFNNGR